VCTTPPFSTIKKLIMWFLKEIKGELTYLKSRVSECEETNKELRLRLYKLENPSKYKKGEILNCHVKIVSVDFEYFPGHRYWKYTIYDTLSSEIKEFKERDLINFLNKK
jgi:hypothetical protein